MLTIIIKKDMTKGIVLRGYENKDFSELEIIKNENFCGNRNNLRDNFISLVKN